MEYMMISHFIKRRLEEELEIAISKNTSERIVLPLNGNDLSRWRGYIKGPDGALHSFEIRIGEKFPLEPPEIEWLTPISHPNIEPPRLLGAGSFGRVCLPWITDPSVWTPQTRINAIVDGLVYLLNNPNPCDPLMHSECLKTAIKMVKEKISSGNLNSNKRSQAQTLLIAAEAALSQGNNHSAIQLIKEACMVIKRRENPT
jgi:ubiquitin-protein ligase